MAILFMDGFDHYASQALGEALGGDEPENNGWSKTSYVNGSTVSDRFTNYNGRAYAGGIGFGGASYLRKTGLPSTANCVLGFAMKELSGWSCPIIKIYDNAEEFLTVYVNSLGYIHLYIEPFQYDSPYNGLIATSTSTLTISRWYYFEFIVTATTANLLVDGVSLVSATGQSFNLIQGFSIHMPNSTRLDDVYITNDTTPLDAPRIITLYPNEGGTETGWKETWREVEASGGYDTSIDEKYISSYTPGDLESWKYNELPPGDWDVYAVSPVIRSKKNDAGTPTISVNLSTGASTSGVTVSDTFTHTKHVENFSDAGGLTAWTKSAVNGLELTVEYD